MKSYVQILIRIVVINVVCRIGIVEDCSRWLGSIFLRMASEMTNKSSEERIHTPVGVRQRHFGTGFPLLWCEVQIERRNVLSRIRHSSLRNTRSCLLTSALPGLPLSSKIPFRLSISESEHGPSSVHPSNSLSIFLPRPRVTTCRTISPSSLTPTPAGPSTIRSTSHVRALSGAKTDQKRSGVLAGGGGVS